MDQKQAIADKLKEANNILVTVSNNPSVDQLAACIGLTLALNKMGKHATAVFSGVVPSTIEFLQPEKTLEKNTDSLRDFIISLDKSKADKLRYKVEDKVVKIFITPYRTSISEKDLEFSQGDFNVDLVLTLGVHTQQELDAAITAHGRILHDAVVATVNVKAGGELGSLNWLEPHASSLSEMAVELVDTEDKQLLDAQMATAFLTGIVAETKRFSNDRTSPTTMSISAELMGAGANQQLVATKLEPKPVAPPPTPAAPHPAAPEMHEAGKPVPLKNQTPKEDGTLEISHPEKPHLDLNAPNDTKVKGDGEEGEEDEQLQPEALMPQIHIDETGSLVNLRDTPPTDSPMLPKPEATIDPTHHMDTQHMIMQPPSMGGQLTANSMPDYLEPDHDDPLSTQPATNMPLLSRDSGPPGSGVPAVTPAPAMSSMSPSLAMPPTPPTPPEPAAPPALSMPPELMQPTPPAVPTPDPAAVPSDPGAPSLPPLNPEPAVPAMPPTPPAPAPNPPSAPGETLSQIEKDVNSPHLTLTPQVDAPAMPGAPSSADAARDAVAQAMASQEAITPGPVQALNAQPLGDPLHDPTAPPLPNGTGTITPTNGTTPPPPVPPPMMPPA